MKIGIDLDGTINNVINTWLSHYNIEWHDNLKIEEVTSWDLADFVKPEAKKAIYDYLRLPGFFYFGVHLQENVLSGIKYLKKMGHSLYIVTAYVPESCLDKYKWLVKFVPQIDPRNIIFCNDKSTMALDVLIDDGIHNFEGFKGKKIIYTRPWNVSCDENIYDYRLNNWKEISHIDLFKNKKQKERIC